MKITISNNIYVQTKNTEIIETLKSRLTYANPEFKKLKALGYAAYNVKREYRMYAEKEDGIVIPRGTGKMARELAVRHNELCTVVDKRTEGKKLDLKLSPNITPYWYQSGALNAITLNQQGMLEAPCVAGNVRVRFNRGGKGFVKTIEKAYESFHGHGRYQWDRAIPTYVRSFNSKTIQLHEIEDILYKGVRDTVEVTLENGRTIRTTPDHKIMTRRGWVPACELTSRDEVMMDSPKTLTYVDPAHEIHHINNDHYDNRIENLTAVTKKEHNRLHHVYMHFKQGVPYFVPVRLITDSHQDAVYDIVCKAPHHNFVANDMVVHNCATGKTVIGCMLMAQEKVPTLVIVHTLDLFKQWMGELEHILCGTYKIGQFGGGKKFHGDITISTVQTLSKLDKIQWEKFNDKYGITLLDECFGPHTKITLSDGTTEEIGKIVNQQMPVKVKTYNFKTDKIENKPIVRFIKNKRQGSMVRLYLNKSTIRDSITCTETHGIFTERGKIKAKDIVVGDIVFLNPMSREKNGFSPDYGENQNQVIYGSKLGDGNISVNPGGRLARLKIRHTKTQFDYLRYKADILGMKIEKRFGLSGYLNKRIIRSASTHSHRQLYDIAKMSPECVFEKLDQRGLAIMFGDNGSCSGRKYLSLHTQRYDKKTNENFIKILKMKWNVDAVLQPTKGKYYNLRFNLNASIKFANIVLPYLHPNVRYKLGEHNKNVDFIPITKDTKEYCSRYIIRTCAFKPFRQEYNNVYNLEIKDNHNYFANGVLVSNCHHCGADTYISVMENLRSKYLIGLTATPKRQDGKNFIVDAYMGKIIHTITPADLEVSGRLVSCDVRLVKTKQRYNFTRMDDNYTKLANAMSKDIKRNEVIAACALQDISEGRIPILLTERVMHAKYLVSLLGIKGVNVEEISGHVPPYERDRIRKSVKEGKIQALVANKQIAAEGLDAPSIDSVHVCFFTKNIGLFKQMIGRGRRVYGNKDTCRVWMYEDEIFREEIDEMTFEPIIVPAYSFQKAIAGFIKWGNSQGFSVDTDFKGF